MCVCVSRFGHQHRMFKFFRHGHLGFLRKHDRISKGALERSGPNLRELSSHVSTGRVMLSRVYYSFQIIRQSQVAVVTLDPTKFAERKQQRFHIGNQTDARIYIRLHNHPSPVLSQPLLYEKKRESRKQIRTPYPPNTKVFLYYLTSPEKPRIAGELRLRIASSDSFASFESGSDLLNKNGQPWSRPLFLVKKFYTRLYEKLREDLLVSDELDAILSSFPQKFFRYSRSQFLYTLNDTFIVDFSMREQYLTVITEQGIEKLSFTGPFVEYRGRRRMPYTGAYIQITISMLSRLTILMNL